MNQSHNRHVHGIFVQIASDNRVSQRSLAANLGIALGLTNLLVRTMVRKGWIRAVRIQPNRVRYLLTPAGIAEKARMSRQSLEYNVRFYSETRDRVSQSLSELAHAWPIRPDLHAEKRIVFFGLGAVAEIAYICLQGTGLRLVGVAGDRGGRPFFDLPVRDVSELRDGDLGDIPYDRVIVTSFDSRETIRARLDAQGVASERVYWL